MNETEYDASTALVVVDMQNDFAHPDGSLYVGGGEDVVHAVNREIERAEAADAFVVYTQDWHPPVTPHFEKDGGIWPVHCVGDTWGAEFVQELRVVGASVKKGTGGEDGYSGFTVRHPESGHETDTEMADLLEARDISRVVVVGSGARLLRQGHRPRRRRNGIAHDGAVGGDPAGGPPTW